MENSTEANGMRYETYEQRQKIRMHSSVSNNDLRSTKGNSSEFSYSYTIEHLKASI